MMIMRHYPPAVLVHVSECVEGSALPAVMASVLETDIYSHRFHFGFAEAGYHLATVTAAHVIRDGIVPMVIADDSPPRQRAALSGFAVAGRAKQCGRQDQPDVAGGTLIGTSSK
jgi:hypothetical protein